MTLAKNLALVTFAVLCCAITAVVLQIPSIIKEESTRWEQRTAKESAAYRADLVKLTNDRTKDLLKIVDERAKQLTKITNDRLSQAVDVIDMRSSDLVASANSDMLALNATANLQLSRANDSLAAVTKLREDFKPTIDGANLLMARNALPAQLIGVTAAAKITLGQSAVTMRAIQVATPALLKSAEGTADNIKEATAASAVASNHAAKAFENIEKQTKPLPLLVRFAPSAVQAVLIALGLLK